jgi:protein SCO1/2
LSMVFAKVPAPRGAPADQYSVDHSATIAVLDPESRMAGIISPPFVPSSIASDLLVLSGHAPATGPGK